MWNLHSGTRFELANPTQNATEERTPQISSGGLSTAVDGAG
jgi:hypothetical protein